MYRKVVTALRASSITRSILVAVMLLSWLVITNHCALAQIQSKQAASAGHAHCHGGGSDDGKKGPGDGMSECCRVVKASLADQADLHLDATKLLRYAFVIADAPGVRTAGPAVMFYFDHGPPGAASFAEIVLQRSLLSHAPPILA